MLWLIFIFAYVLPFVVNYIIIRKELKINNSAPDSFDFISVVLPVFNLAIMFLLFLHSNVTTKLLSKFFMLSNKRRKV